MGGSKPPTGSHSGAFLASSVISFPVRSSSEGEKALTEILLSCVGRSPGVHGGRQACSVGTGSLSCGVWRRALKADHAH